MYASDNLETFSQSRFGALCDNVSTLRTYGWKLLYLEIELRDREVRPNLGQGPRGEASELPHECINGNRDLRRDGVVTAGRLSYGSRFC